MACSRKGLPPQYWGVGLMVLLEKTCGNNHIHKMRTIVLLKGDFNYYNKTIFAWRMMTLAQDRGQIPLKCFAKKGSNCINAIMTKVMMCDKSRIHHHPTCIGGNDFGDCYARIARSPASVALQSWGIPKESVCLIFMAMQTMQFFLCTGIWRISWIVRRYWWGQDTWARTGGCCSRPRFYGLECKNC